MERLFGFVMILSLIVAVIAWDGLSGKSEAEREPRCRGLNNAWTMAKTIVRQHLGDPLIVSFPDRNKLYGVSGTSLRHLGDCRYKIAAFVDAYYPQGNLERRYFVIELSYRGGNGWLMDQLDFAELPQTGKLSSDTGDIDSNAL